MAGQKKMTDNDTFSEIAFFIKNTRPCLTDHLVNGLDRPFPVIRHSGKTKSQFIIPVFKIRKPDIHGILQKADRFRLLIAAGIVYHRKCQPLFLCKCQPFQDPGNKMFSRHQIDVCCPLFLKFQKNLCQPFFADLFSKATERKFPVLTENTAQRTAGKKYRPGASASGNTGLFPHMKRRSSHTEHGIFPAGSFFAGKTVRMTLSRTKRTALIKLVLQVFTFFYLTPFFRTFNRHIFSTVPVSL